MIYIEVGDKKRPFACTWRALKNFELQTKKSFTDLGSLNFVDLEILFTECFRAAETKETNKLSDLKPKDIADWLDNDLSLMTKLSDEIATAFKTKSSEKGKKK